MDGIEVPICTGGRHSCLWFQVLQRGFDEEAFRIRQLEAVLRGAGPSLWEDIILRDVAHFLWNLG